MIQEILAGTEHLPETVKLITTTPRFERSIAIMESWGGMHSSLGVPVTIHKYVQDVQGTQWYLLDYEVVDNKLYVLCGKGEDTTPYLSHKIKLAREKVKEQGIVKNNPYQRVVNTMPDIKAPTWDRDKFNLAPDVISETFKQAEDAGSNPA